MSDNIIAGIVVAVIFVFAIIGFIDWVDGPDQVAPPVKIVNEEAIKETAKLTAKALEIIRENQIAHNARQERIDYQAAIIGVYWPLAIGCVVIVGIMAMMIYSVIKANRALANSNMELRRIVNDARPRQLQAFNDQVARY